MLICTYHVPTKQCLCGTVRAKSMGDCEICEDGGSGICTDHTCYKTDLEQKFPLGWHVNPDTGKLEKIPHEATA